MSKQWNVQIVVSDDTDEGYDTEDIVSFLECTGDLDIEVLNISEVKVAE